MQHPDCEVIVVGAGPTGLLAAALLTRNGVSVRIFDKQPQGANESRALGVQARTVELFLNLGMADELLNRGTIVTTACIFLDGNAKAELHFDHVKRADTPYPFVLVVPQRETEMILRDELRRLGVEVERPVEVTSIAQSPDGVTVLAKGTDGAEFAVRAAYLVGADGAHSLVRKALGLSFAGAPYPQDFLLADCRADGLPESDGFGMYLHGTSFAVHLPLPGEAGLGRVITSRIGPNEPMGDAAGAPHGGRDVPLSEVEQAFRAATNTAVRLKDPIWTSLYRVHHRGVDRYGEGRAFVAGDAAHIHSPAGGQGMNTGLQDVANLAWKLVLALRRDAAPHPLLATYHAERWPVGQRVLKETDRVFSAMTSSAGWFAALRNAVVPRVAGMLSVAGFAWERAFSFVSQLGIRYEANAFVLDEASRRKSHFWRQGPASGHRAPNALFARNQDVFGLLCGYRFHVLALSRRPLTGTEVGSLCDELAALPSPPGIGLATHLIAFSASGQDGRMARAELAGVFTAYGLDQETPQALYLIRPDGYIAWRADRTAALPELAAFVRERFC